MFHFMILEAEILFCATCKAYISLFDVYPHWLTPVLIPMHNLNNDNDSGDDDDIITI